jgi:putative transposase
MGCFRAESPTWFANGPKRTSWRRSATRKRLLSIVDAYIRQCAGLEADTSFSSWRVTRVLEKAMNEYGWPKRIRCDNGPELTSRHFLAWAIERGIELLHIQPGRPMQNGRIDSFHGKLRDEFLNVSSQSPLRRPCRGRWALWSINLLRQKPRATAVSHPPLTPSKPRARSGTARAARATASQDRESKHANRWKGRANVILRGRPNGQRAK